MSVEVLNLLLSPRPGRYQFHDLVRRFAAEKAESVLGPVQPPAAAGL